MTSTAVVCARPAYLQRYTDTMTALDQQLGTTVAGMAEAVGDLLRAAYLALQLELSAALGQQANYQAQAAAALQQPPPPMSVADPGSVAAAEAAQQKAQAAAAGFSDQAAQAARQVNALRSALGTFQSLLAQAQSLTTQIGQQARSAQQSDAAPAKSGQAIAVAGSGGLLDAVALGGSTAQLQVESDTKLIVTTESELTAIEDEIQQLPQENKAQAQKGIALANKFASEPTTTTTTTVTTTLLTASPVELAAFFGRLHKLGITFWAHSRPWLALESTPSTETLVNCLCAAVTADDLNGAERNEIIAALFPDESTWSNSGAISAVTIAQTIDRYLAASSPETVVTFFSDLSSAQLEQLAQATPTLFLTVSKQYISGVAQNQKDNLLNGDATEFDKLVRQNVTTPLLKAQDELDLQANESADEQSIAEAIVSLVPLGSAIGDSATAVENVGTMKQLVQDYMNGPTAEPTQIEQYEVQLLTLAALFANHVPMYKKGQVIPIPCTRQELVTLIQNPTTWTTISVGAPKSPNTLGDVLDKASSDTKSIPKRSASQAQSEVQG